MQDSEWGTSPRQVPHAGIGARCSTSVCTSRSKLLDTVESTGDYKGWGYWGTYFYKTLRGCSLSVSAVWRENVEGFGSEAADVQTSNR